MYFHTYNNIYENYIRYSILTKRLTDQMAYAFENNWNVTLIMLDTFRAGGTRFLTPHASRLTPHASRLTPKIQYSSTPSIQRIHYQEG